MGVGFFCQWEIIFLSGEKSFGFVGEVVVVIFLPDPHHRFGAEVCLFDLMKREGPIVFRRCRDEKFAFDFHDKYPFWDAGGCGRRFDRQFL